MSFDKFKTRVVDGKKLTARSSGLQPILHIPNDGGISQRFPNAKDNFSVSTESVVPRSQWFQRMPQPSPKRTFHSMERRPLVQPLKDIGKK